MAGRGPAPKDPEKRRRRNADPVPTTVVSTSDDEVRGPELPGGVEWPAPTVAWWRTWRMSPQAAAFTPTDWDFLLDTALLHARLWDGEESSAALAKVASEVRLRAAKFGATPEDRARLRMQVSEPEGPADDGKQTRESRYAHLRIAD